MSLVDMKAMYKLEGKMRLKSSSHPFLDLLIWNYEEIVHYEDTWCPITLMARALVVETSTGKIIGRALPKFFNFTERPKSVTIPKHEGNFRIFDKLDGSLFILFNYNGEWIYSSRGSFISTQAKEGENILKEMFPQHINLDKGLTYVFELIYPENRIVLDYGSERTVKFLTAYETDGTEHLILDRMKDLGFNIVTEYFFSSSNIFFSDKDVSLHFNELSLFDREVSLPEKKALNELCSMNINNREGFVIRYENGDRVKVKFEDYIKLHKIRTNFSNRVIFEKWINKVPIEEALRDIPDEFNEWFRTGIKELNEKVDEIMETSKAYISGFNSQLDRKDFYAKLLTDVKMDSLKGAINMLYNDKSVESVIEYIKKSLSHKDITTKGQTPKWKLDQLKKNNIAIYLIGCSGVGKSYWTERFMRGRRDVIRVSRDALRHALYVIPDSRTAYDYYNHRDLKKREDEISKLCKKIANDAFANGKTVIFDNTNVDYEYLKTDISNLPSNVEIRFEIFNPLAEDYQLLHFGEILNEEVTLNRLHKRTVDRGMEVPKKNIIKQLKNLKNLLPRLNDLKMIKGNNNLTQDESLPLATIFDIDGTLAHHGLRNVYDMSKVDEDKPFNHIIGVAKALHASGMTIILCSGREEKARNLTIKWMNKYGIEFSELHFRPNKDNRKDYIVKEEMWRDLIKRYYIVQMFDDRDQVVNHARSLGFNVSQVAEGNF